MGSYFRYVKMIMNLLLRLLGLSFQTSNQEIQSIDIKNVSEYPLPIVRYNNSCLYNQVGLNREEPRNFDCPRWVIETTDQIWNMYRDFDVVESYLRRYMADDWESITSMGEYLQGIDEVICLVNTTLTAFPDIKLHIMDTFCDGNDIDGYKTSMPVLHTATHTGYHPA